MLDKGLFVFALLATATAVVPQYKTILETGEQRPESTVTHHSFTFTIQSGQCTGQANVIGACSHVGVGSKVLNLKTAVTDNVAYPAVVFPTIAIPYPKLGLIHVYRKGDCRGKVTVEVTATCHRVGSPIPWVHDEDADHVHQVNHDEDAHILAPIDDKDVQHL